METIDLDALSVLQIPSHLHNHYEMIILVESHAQALQVSDFGDQRQLIVTSDWLSWRMLSDQGVHCLHFEAMLGTWSDQRGSQENLVMEANAWHFDGEKDVSLFDGVSLGNGFCRQMTYMFNAYHRLRVSLGGIISTYRPKKIVCYGIRTESDILDSHMVKILLDDVNKAHEVDLVIKQSSNQALGTTYPVGPFLKTSGASLSLGGTTLRSCLRQSYLFLVTYLFKLRFFFTKTKPRIYLFLNWLAIRELIYKYDRNDLTPVLLAEPWPKSVSFILTCLRRGVLLTRLPSMRLVSSDREKINIIISEFERLWANQTSAFQNAQAYFVRQNFLNSKLIHTRANEVKNYQALLSKAKIDRAVVGDSENWICGTIIDLARANGIPSDELLNGMFLASQKTPNRSYGQNKIKPSLGRLLSWGQANDNWLKSINSPMEAVRTGYPVVRTPERRPRKAASVRRKALLLPVIPSGDDPAALFTQTFFFLISTSFILRANQIDQIRLKIHPGHPSTKDYFQRIFQYYELDCEVVTDGPLSEQTAWADIVIGPVNSGSHVEVLAQSIPYYPCQILPSSLASNLFGPVPVFNSLDDLEKAIRESYEPDYDMILEFFCSSQSIDNPSDKFWHEMHLSSAHSGR